ncbi:hypothetical protein CW700_04860 [Candidatus Bathyarchaeota archaeon]|nr:MAG: hypothetical protein CW700_04860 [Candidatus Bathyarchaeota archaeon]
MSGRGGVDRLRLLPKYYLVVSGAALSPVSPLNAFDGALKAAGIHNTNLVAVSSILPRGVVHLELNREELASFFEPGEILFVVQAVRMGREGEYLSAGLMWGEGVTSNGLVVEHTSSREGPSREELEEVRREVVEALRSKFQEGVRIRGIRTKEPRFKVAEVLVPEGMYGCALVALILC